MDLLDGNVWADDDYQDLKKGWAEQNATVQPGETERVLEE